MERYEAIGLIETFGLVFALEAADAMCKAADVDLIGYENVASGYISVVVQGDVGACRTAVLLNAGAGLYVGGSALTLEAGVKRAAQLIDSGLAMEKLEDFIMMSQNMGKVEKVKITSCQDDEDYDIIKGTLI